MLFLTALIQMLLSTLSLPNILGFLSRCPFAPLSGSPSRLRAHSGQDIASNSDYRSGPTARPTWVYKPLSTTLLAVQSKARRLIFLICKMGVITGVL